MQTIRRDPAKSYRFDAETLELIGRLREAMRDPRTGQTLTATDVVRASVRMAAKKFLEKSGK